MDEREHDKLRWQVAQAVAGEGAPPPPDDPPWPDELLLAYRSGSLSEAERDRVESMLEDSPDARRRLIELAAGRLSALPVELRTQVLAHAPRASRSYQWRFVAALAACLILAIGIVVQLRTSSPSSLIGRVDYEVAVTGLTAVRSETGDTQQLVAYPDTMVRLEITPVHRALAGVEFGLYVEQDEQLQRLQAGPGITLEEHRGAAAFEARAAELVGTNPGSYRLYLVVAEHGDLPERCGLEAGREPETVLADGHRLVYRRTLILKPAH